MILASALIGGSALACLGIATPRTQKATLRKADAVGMQKETAQIVKAANAFLATLNEPQRKSLLFASDDAQQRARWSNFLTGFVRRAGLNLGELNAAQRTAGLALVASALSKRGYEKVQQIVEADEVLKNNEGGNRMFGKDLYYLSILGTPSE